jgi:hypothetical protein
MKVENSLNKFESTQNGMKSKIYLATIIFLMLILPSISLVSAIDDLGTFKKYSCVQLIQTCPNCTYVNISRIIYPDTTQALGQVAMVRTGTFYNYSFCKTSQLGTYTVNGFGDLDGLEEVWVYTFTITPSGGPENNTTFFIIFAVSAVVLLVLAFMFENYVFSIISGFTFLGLGVYSMANGFGNITNLYTQILSVIIIGFGGIITIISGLDLIKETETGDSLYSGYGFKGEDDF